jgi:hypothetical protein
MPKFAGSALTSEVSRLEFIVLSVEIGIISDLIPTPNYVRVIKAQKQLTHRNPSDREDKDPNC